MPITQLDPNLIRADASAGTAKIEADAIDLIIAKINEIVDEVVADISGTTNKVAKFTSATTVGDSSITDNGTTVSVGSSVFTVSVANGNTVVGGTLNVSGASIAFAGQGTLSAASTSLTLSTSGVPIVLSATTGQVQITGTGGLGITAGHLDMSTGTNVDIIGAGSAYRLFGTSGNASFAGTLAADGNVTLGNLDTRVHRLNGRLGINRDAEAGYEIDVYPSSGGTNADVRLTTNDAKALAVSVRSGSSTVEVSATNGVQFTSAVMIDGNATVGNATSDSHRINGKTLVAAAGSGDGSTGAAIDLVSGRDSFGVLTGTTNDVAFQYGSGGFRHWVTTEHNATGTGNRFKIWLNTGATAGASSAPGTGNSNVLTVTNEGAQVNGTLTASGNVTLGDASTDRVGVGIAPDSNHAMTFAAAVGNKIALYPDSATAAYGFGIQAGTLQYYVPLSTQKHAFGYGDSDAFTEVAAIGPNGIVVNQGPSIRAGSGTPEGAVTAPVGSLFLRTDGGAATTLYVKESGAGNTGWVGK